MAVNRNQVRGFHVKQSEALLLIIWEGPRGELDRRVVRDDESALAAIKSMCGDCNIEPNDTIRIVYERKHNKSK